MPTHISIFTRKSNSLLLAAAALSLTMAASCELPPSDGGIGFEYTGRVLYEDTKEPIEGAYVLAVYEKVDLGWAGASRNCIKTKGMTTGKDGKFNFPIDKLDGNSPSQAFAIKPDHFFEGRNIEAKDAKEMSQTERI
jgi:hypothetical protein